MQMGRWFGYRSGYADLVRLYIGRSESIGKKTIDLYRAFEAMCRDEEQFRRVECAFGSDQPLVPVMVRHVVRRQEHRVVAGGVEPPVRAVDDPRLRQRGAAFGAEVVDDELAMLGGVRGL